MSRVGAVFWRTKVGRRGYVLRESGTLLVFLGSLAHQAYLNATGTQALDRFAAQGYIVARPITIEPVTDPQALSGAHGGGWAPGRIGLRPHPAGLFGADHYLVHELAHEAVFQTCGVINDARNEALTLLLSGELHSAPVELATIQPTTAVADMRALWEVAGNRAPISIPAERAVRRVAAPYAGAPHKPCVLPEPLEATLKGPPIAASADAVVLSLLSGRTLQERGNVTRKRPLGSLLKILYASASRTPLTTEAFTALARSDEALLGASTAFDPERFRLLATSLTSKARPLRIDRSTMGFVSSGDYPYQGSLQEIALALRAAILLKGRETWTPLATLTQDPNHTLHAAPASVRDLLTRHHAWAKTGTLSLTDGTPMSGLVAVVWPQPHPTLIALFSREGVRGSHVLDNDLTFLQELFNLLEPAERAAQSSIMTALPPQSFTIETSQTSSCPDLLLPSGERTTLCGAMAVTTHAHGAVPRRFFHGILRESSDHPLLLTDPHTFSSYVGAREAAGTPPQVQDAIEAIAAWNGTMATHGHPTGALCDTTHCMVQMGWPRPVLPPVSYERLALLPPAFAIFRRNEREKDARWIEFSLDSNEPWQRTVSRETLARVCAHTAPSLPQRIRTKSGEVFFQVLTEHGPDLIPCDRFMTHLDLPSCPATLTAGPDETHLTVSGMTVGHGRGFSLQQARDRCNTTARCNSLELLEELLAHPAPAVRKD